MKRFFLTAALGVMCSSATGQGTLNFANSGPNLDAKVYDVWGVPLVNTNYIWLADLYWAPGITTDLTMFRPLNSPASFSSDPTQAGLFFGGPRTIPAAPGSTITAQVRVWNLRDGASWIQATLSPGLPEIGESSLFLVTLADPTNAPAIMTNLNGHPCQLFPVINVLDLNLYTVEITDVGLRSNQFGFNIVPVLPDPRPPTCCIIGGFVIQASSNPPYPPFVPVQTNYPLTFNPFYFTDPEWANYPIRSYRVFLSPY